MEKIIVSGLIIISITTIILTVSGNILFLV